MFCNNLENIRLSASLLSQSANYFHNGSAFQFAVNPIARTSAIGYFASKALTSEVKWLLASKLLSQ